MQPLPLPTTSTSTTKHLDLANNKLKTMAGLSGLHQLRKLDLGANRIRVMEPSELAGLVRLEELWLGKNKIERMQGLETLQYLRRLDIQSNRLTAIENLQQSQADTLEELYLAHNGIDDAGVTAAGVFESLQFQKLTVLDLGRNKLTGTDAFCQLQTLEELWLSGNQIESFDNVQSLAALTNLETIYLEYNDIQTNDSLEVYRQKLAELVTSLKQIDANLIGVAAATSNATTTTTTTEQERLLSRLQDLVVERARAETNQVKK
jgi:protein phosphatase 1 regulatory subunit 7